jgi:hypothetical protein
MKCEEGKTEIFVLVCPFDTGGFQFLCITVLGDLFSQMIFLYSQPTNLEEIFRNYFLLEKSLLFYLFSILIHVY